MRGMLCVEGTQVSWRAREGDAQHAFKLSADAVLVPVDRGGQVKGYERGRKRERKGEEGVAGCSAWERNAGGSCAARIYNQRRCMIAAGR